MVYFFSAHDAHGVSFNFQRRTCNLHATLLINSQLVCAAWCFAQSSACISPAPSRATARCRDVLCCCRQESYFHYLFGVEDEDCYGALDLQTGKSYLFVPHLPESYTTWMGKIKVRMRLLQTAYTQTHAQYAHNAQV